MGKIATRKFSTSAEVDAAVTREGVLPFVDIADSVYFGTKALSQSTLQKMKESPSKCRHDMDQPPRPSEAMVLGSAIHCALLEPDKFNNLYASKPKVDRRTKAGKETMEKWESDNGNKIGLTDEEFAIVERVCQRFFDSEKKAKYLRGEVLKEISFFGRDDISGLIMRAKADVFNVEMNTVVDIKTTMSAKKIPFSNSIRDFGYDFQAAYYMDLIEQTTGVRPDQYIVLAVEKHRDCDSIPYTFSDEYLRKVSLQRRVLLDKFAECCQTERWPGYPDEVITYEPPKFVSEALDSLW